MCTLSTLPTVTTHIRRFEMVMTTLSTALSAHSGSDDISYRIALRAEFVGFFFFRRQCKSPDWKLLLSLIVHFLLSCCFNRIRCSQLICGIFIINLITLISLSRHHCKSYPPSYPTIDVVWETFYITKEKKTFHDTLKIIKKPNVDGLFFFDI